MQAISKLLEALVIAMSRAADQPTEKAVHELRVIVNRAAAMLLIFEKEIPHARRLKKYFKRIRKYAGAVRDRDVIRRLLLRQRLSSLDSACIYLLGQRDLAAEQLQSFLRNQLEQKLLPSLGKKAEWKPSISIEASIEELLADGRAVAESSNVDELHSFRKSAKRLRYTIEILDSDGGGKWVTRLRRVQDELGQMNDASVAVQFLQALPSRSKRAQIVAAQLNAKVEAQIVAFRKAWIGSYDGGSEKAWLSWARSIGE